MKNNVSVMNLSSFLLLITTICAGIIVGCSPEEITIKTDQAIVGDNASNSTDEQYGPNLLKNGGLEVWTDQLMGDYAFPYYWTSQGDYYVTKNRMIVSEGNYSARMESMKSGITARVAQRIPITPGSKIRIRFNYYVEQWKTNGARTYCYFRTASAESANISISELKEFYSDNEYLIIRGGGYGINYLPHSLNDWLIFDETIVVPPNATFFVFGINSYCGTTIYVDDCYIGELIE